jgi:hypothetical protein
MSEFMEIDDNKIFKLEVNTNDESKRKIIGKYTYTELHEKITEDNVEKKSEICNRFGIDNQTMFENSKLYYPELSGEKFKLASTTMGEICSNIQDKLKLLENINNVYKRETKDKNSFLKDFDSLKFIKEMTEEEAIKYINNLPNLSLDEWIETLPDSLYISSYSSLKKGISAPPFEIQTKIFNELLSHFLTVELIYSISEEIEKEEVDENKIKYKNIINKFQDIKGILENNNNLKKIYSIYHMFKCLCFILHDKPVDELAPFLLNFYEKRIEDSKNKIEFMNIFKQGFSIQGMNAKVTQNRCHNTIDELTNKFNEIMKNERITTPDINKVFSIPYTAFRLDSKKQSSYKEEDENTLNIMDEMKRYLKYYNYGLGDAVGTETFINDLDKTSIYPDTLALQDAAGSTHSKNEIEVNENMKITKNLDNISKNLEYVIKCGKYLDECGIKKNVLNIEPLRFLDICILCVKINGVNKFLYYASGFDYNETNYPTISDNFYVPKEFTKYNDQGTEKTLIGIITAKVSQNDTISLLNEYVDITKSARGRGSFVVNPGIWWLYKNTNTENEKNIKIILGTLAKEAGDQSKIQVIENLSRNGINSYVATVDSFFSHSFINGGVVWKGGNVEIYIPQGFEVPSEELIEQTTNVLLKTKSYGFDKITEKINHFCIEIVKIIDSILNDSTVSLPSSTIFTFYAIKEVMSNVDNFLNEEIFNNIVKSEYNINIHSGIFNEQSLLRRLINFNKVSELFSLLDDEINESFSIKINNVTESNIRSIIESYLKTITIDNNNYYLKDLELFIEQLPLFFLMRHLDNLNTITFKKQRVNRNEPEKDLSIQVREKIRNIISSKLKNFCEKYNVSMDLYAKYLREKQLVSVIKEDKFDDTDVENKNIEINVEKITGEKRMLDSNDENIVAENNQSRKKVIAKRSKGGYSKKNKNIKNLKNKTIKHKYVRKTKTKKQYTFHNK